MSLGVLARGDLLAQPPARAQQSGARGLSMNRVVIPPGGAGGTPPSCGIGVGGLPLQGRVKTLYGACLEKMVINQAGDFLFIPPGCPTWR
jgi:uncharacterized RmlC-like cupin family protein